MAKRRWLEATFRESFRRHGYREIQTPTFETVELFEAKSGPNVVNEIYAFEDKGGRRMCLRPELTAPVIRFYLNELTHEPKPLKVYYYGPCYRYEEPQEGRYREFWQFGLELIGPEGPAADAEVIAVAWRALRDAGLRRFTTHVGHIGALRALVNALPLEPKRRGEVFRRIDKDDPELDAFLDSLGVEPKLASAVASIAKHRRALDPRDEPEVGRFFAEARAVVAPLDIADEASAAIEKALQDLQATVPLLAAYGVERFELDLGVARGLDYYTGTVFEFHSQELGAQSQIGGGGAYTLAEVFGGEHVGTAGFGLGFDRILLALEREGAVPKPAAAAEYYVVPIGDAARAPAIDLARRLRDKGVSADVDLMGRAPGKALQYASKLGVARVVLIGEKELAARQVTLRDMASGQQSQVGVDELLAKL